MLDDWVDWFDGPPEIYLWAFICLALGIVLLTMFIMQRALS